MIITETISPSALRILIPEKLKADDFAKIAPQIDSIIGQQGNINLLIDASRFSGWEDITAFENHAGFVKAHQSKVERIAVIVGHDWQHWLIGTVRIFAHPKVRAYDKGREQEALQWISAGSAPMGNDIHYKEWRIDVIQSGPGWEALVYRPSSPLHECSVPRGHDRHIVIEEAKAFIDKTLAA